MNQNLILSSWPLRASIDLLNSSEMSNLWASNSSRIRSTRSANHSWKQNLKTNILLVFSQKSFIVLT